MRGGYLGHIVVGLGECCSQVRGMLWLDGCCRDQVDVGPVLYLGQAGIVNRWMLGPYRC